jgi:4-amino-4-deoxy-L-arabinose transferase-like glycosyltransferase
MLARMRSQRIAWTWAIALLLLRAVVIALSVPAHRPLTGDEPAYDNVARSLLAGHGFVEYGQPWVWKPPIWPMLLAGIQALFGHDGRIVAFIQALFDAGTACMAWIAARLMFGSARAGWIAMALAAAWPPFIREARLFQTEPVFTFAVALSMAAFVNWALRPGVKSGFTLGLACGLAAMTRPNGLAPGFALLAVWLVLDAMARRHMRTVAMVLLGVMLVVAPWAVRNAEVFHAFIPFSTGGGEVFALGTSTATDGRWEHVAWIEESGRELHAEELRLGHPLTIPEKDAALYRLGFRHWREDPKGQMVLWTRRLWRSLALPLGGDSWAVRIAFLLVLLVLYAFSCVGVVRGWRGGQREGRLPAAMVAAFVLNVLALSTIAASSRYTEPVRTLLFVVSAGPLAAWMTRRDAQREGRLVA